jgi:oxygen-dependent protoporphyrinogen oxidase
MQHPIHIAVIGGGISGLATAHYINQKAQAAGIPIHCSVLEADSRAGGKIITSHMDGHIFEGGPESFVTRKPWTWQLCLELGLQDRLIGADDAGRNYVLKGGRPHPVPSTPQGFASTTLLSLKGKLRAAQEIVLPRDGSTGDESLGHFVRRRFGDEVLEKLVAPAVGSIYLSDVDHLSTRVSFERFMQLEQAHGSVLKGMLAMQRAGRKGKRASSQTPRPPSFLTLQGGLGELIDTLLVRLHNEGADVFLNAGVESIDKMGDSYRLRLAGHRSITADGVVLAMPAFAMARLIAPHDHASAALLQSVRYIDVATISLAYPASAMRRPFNGFGVVAPAGESPALLACEVVSNKWPQRTAPGEILLRAFAGGHANESIVGQRDDTLINMTHAEVMRIFGIDEKPAMARVTRWQPGNPQYPVGHLEALKKVEASLTDTLPNVFLTGAAMRGLGIPDCVRQAGETAAQVVQSIKSSAVGTPVEAHTA